MTKKTDYEKGWDDCYRAMKVLYRDNAKQIRAHMNISSANIKGLLKAVSLDPPNKTNGASKTVTRRRANRVEQLPAE